MPAPITPPGGCPLPADHAPSRKRHAEPPPAVVLILSDSSDEEEQGDHESDDDSAPPTPKRARIDAEVIVIDD